MSLDEHDARASAIVGAATADSEPNTVADDRLEGAKAIASFIGETERRTRYLIDRDLIPVGRLGNRYYGSKAVLRAHWQKLTGAKPTASPAPANIEA